MGSIPIVKNDIAHSEWQDLPILFINNWNEITETTVANLHALTEILLTAPEEFKLVVSVNQAHVYTNDLILINRLDRMPQLRYKTYSQAQVVRPKNTVKLKKSPHQFRTYLKTYNLTAQQKDYLENFLISQINHVRVSPALQRWIDQPFTRLQDYFFADHDTETWVTMLNLVVPGIVRKTMHIITAK
jgi:hypothetical protein